ncbi:uncharacterized protein LOC126403578 [Epinephelus moara]|uniref:uncharacterized protein LOC126403578 n=1 Tax=Epinephelus moara TaxID=300413 RepID=UPI00214ECDC2|nr:uncharacterized protein LOC126403578 [Epinephelus moara]
MSLKTISTRYRLQRTCPMSLQFLLWAVLVYRSDTVSCRLKVEGCVGGDVLLPCVYSDSLPHAFSVYWSDNDNNIVLDIHSSVPDLSNQHVKFRGRVLSDPQLCRKGNFSIVMKNVLQSDSCPYDCYIPSVNFHQRVALSVSGTCGASGGGTTVTPHPFLTALPPLLLSLTWTGLKLTENLFPHHFRPKQDSEDRHVSHLTLKGLVKKEFYVL